MAGRLVLFLCRKWSGRFGSRKAGRGLATKLHPHLIGVEWYVGTEVVEQQKRIDAGERRSRGGQGAIGSERLIDGVAAGGDGRVACSLLVQTISWELWDQQGWQRPCNETPPSPHWT